MNYGFKIKGFWSDSRSVGGFGLCEHIFFFAKKEINFITSIVHQYINEHWMSITHRPDTIS